MESDQSGNISNASFRGDISQQNVYIASLGNISGMAGGDISNVRNCYVSGDSHTEHIEIDREVANLLEWLAEQQGISPELALKKAVATAAYIHDVTMSQGGKLLVKRKDNSVGEIILK